MLLNSNGCVQSLGKHSPAEALAFYHILVSSQNTHGVNGVRSGSRSPPVPGKNRGTARRRAAPDAPAVGVGARSSCCGPLCCLWCPLSPALTGVERVSHQRGAVALGIPVSCEGDECHLAPGDLEASHTAVYIRGVTDGRARLPPMAIPTFEPSPIGRRLRTADQP